MFNNRHNFSDNRPMGLNNSTRLVEHYFPQSSFDIVNQVHYNLGLLQTLAHHIPTFKGLSDNVLAIEGIQKYLGDIVAVAQNLNNIVTVHNELPLVQDLAPRLTQFANEMACVNNKLEFFETNYKDVLALLDSKVKYLEDLYVQYECGLKSIIEEQMAQLTIAGNGYVNRLSQMVEEVAEWKIYIDANIPKVKQFIEGQEAFNIRLVHLEASDAVNLWLVTKSEEDFTKALKAIKYSESFGNDETGNRIRIEYRKETNVFTIMKDNSTNIVVDTKPTSCDGGCNV
nr:MAG TPA: hypothetical protein [Caudoviricetes sp.]